MFETNSIFVTDETGQEKEMEILFTFDNKDDRYVLFVDPNSETGEVFASRYDESGNLFTIEDEEEWAMIEEVLGAFQEDEEAE